MNADTALRADRDAFEEAAKAALHGWYVSWRRGSDVPPEGFYSDVRVAGNIAKTLGLWDGAKYVPPWRRAERAKA